MTVGIDRPGARSLWGKTIDSTGTFPLAAHLLDTGAVLAEYLETWVRSPQRDRLAEMCGLGARPESLPNALGHLAALHDVGKATPYFQGKAADRCVPGSNNQMVADVVESLGDQLIRDIIPADEERFERHAFGSGVALRRRVEIGDFACDVLAGHHGVFEVDLARFEPQPTQFGRPPILSGCASLWAGGESESPWVEAWDELAEICAEAFGEPLPRVENITSVPFITHLVVIADWIASQREVLRTAPLNSLARPARYVAARRGHIAKALEGLLGPPPPDTTGRAFAAMFPDVGTGEPNQLQRSMMELPERPGLTLVTAPMGVGKTEAALSRALLGRRGFYFALPTGATAKAMFGRVRSFVAAVADPSKPVSGSLLFHTSPLEDFYRAPVPVDGSATVSDGETAIVASEWLKGRHLALLATVGVGTVDRLLHGVLPHRYGFLKLGALAGRTVILDEVHAYDAYTSALVVRLVEWLAVGGADVVLLSATLPRAVTAELVSAWRSACAAANDHAADDADVSGATYPALMHVPAEPGGQILVKEVETSSYELGLEYFDGPDAATIAARARAIFSSRPPCFTAVIVNTVTLAQQIAEIIDRGADVDLHVLHSRMTARQRREATDVIEAVFGRDRSDMIERHVVLVATQVAEVSLDIDVDVMVSQLAPVAALLQRSGRLWRHSRANRKGSGPARFTPLTARQVPVRGFDASTDVVEGARRRTPRPDPSARRRAGPG
ncbi:MAG: CRISPR-associated helicase Cas3' [Microthrixaceae bacterium]